VEEEDEIQHDSSLSEDEFSISPSQCPQFKISNPEKELYDRLHEAVQLDYVNSGPELLLDPMKLAEVVNRRLREIFQTELSRPLPTILLNEFTFFNLFC